MKFEGKMDGTGKHLKWSNPGLELQTPHLLSHNWIPAPNVCTYVLMWEWLCIEAKKNQKLEHSRQEASLKERAGEGARTQWCEGRKEIREADESIGGGRPGKWAVRRCRLIQVRIKMPLGNSFPYLAIKKMKPIFKNPITCKCSAFYSNSKVRLSKNYSLKRQNPRFRYHRDAKDQKENIK